MMDPDEYMKLYDAACALEIIIEDVEEGYPLTRGGLLIENAKQKLRILRTVLKNPFFARFESVKLTAGTSESLECAS